MKNKIAYKLTFYILLVVLISILTVGVLFIQIFKSYTFENRVNLMLERARNISELVGNSVTGGGQMVGIGGLMRFIDTMSEARVWILDSNGEVVQITGQGMMGGSGGVVGSTNPLPSEAKKVIAEVLKGHESIGKDFSGVYNETTLSVASPIKGSDGKTIGAVLLHMPVTGITEATNKAIQTLVISIIAALILAAGAALFFSRAISKPLLLMNSAAREMAEGNYDTRTQVRTKDELGQLSESLDQLAWKLGKTMEELEEQENLRREFVANVSHEFRTPLTIIQASLEALIDKTIVNEDEKEDFIGRMLSETKGLERLVKDLLDLSTLQLGKSTLNIERINLSDIIKDVTKNMNRIANKRNISINFAVPSDQISIQGDYDRIVQLLKIFMDNSIKFSKENSSIEVFVNKEKENFITVVLEDKGEGVSEEDLPKIWDRFYIGDKSRAKVGTAGTGLGLSIAKSIVDAHGGELLLNSIKGEGTTVKIFLPQERL